MYKRVICECIVAPGYCESRKQLCSWNYSCGIRLWPGTWEVDWGCRLRSKSRGALWFPSLVRAGTGLSLCVLLFSSRKFSTNNYLRLARKRALSVGRWGFDSLVLAWSGHKNRGLIWSKREQSSWQHWQWTESENKAKMTKTESI